LGREVSGAITDAFGPVPAPPGPDDGISGDYLPLASARAPLSLSLIADDPRTFLASAQLLGSPTVPQTGIATRFTGDSSWHTRQGPDTGGVTFWADLEPRTEATGALQLIPGSHLPEFERRLREYGAAEPAASGFEDWAYPHVAIETEPGDLVAVHAHLRGRAQGGTPRLSWTIDYLTWPGVASREQLDTVRDLIIDGTEYDGYDRQRWPVWDDWTAGAAAVPSRSLAVARLRLLGVLPAGSELSPGS
jgi:Phytanoyl-CoA dioxygenase (PhyH)